MAPCPWPLFLVLSSCLLLRLSGSVFATTTAPARMDGQLVCANNSSKEFARLGLALNGLQDDIADIKTQLALLTGQLSEEFGPDPSGTSPLTDCPGGWTKDNRNCFLMSQVKLSWHEAQRECVQLERSAKLLSLHSDTVDTINSLVGIDGVWLGLHRVVGSARWSWVDGSPVDYTNWRAGEPNNAGHREDCVAIYGDTRDWNDYSCLYNISYICHLQLS